MSAIRSYLSPLVPVCRAIAPIAMDFAVTLYMDKKHQIAHQLFVGTVCGVGTLGCLWWRRNISTLEKVATGVLFTAWKAVEAFLVLKTTARANQRITPINRLQRNFIFSNEDRVNIEEIRQRWQLQELSDPITAVLNDAVKDLNTLYAELATETKSFENPQEQFKAMAAKLQNEKKYRDRFITPRAHPLKKPVQLLTFYRLLRGQGYLTMGADALPHYGDTLDENYAKLFDGQGMQRFWRKTYNDAIQKWAPVIEHLPEDSPLRQWAVEDNAIMPAPDNFQSNVFKLRPITW